MTGNERNGEYQCLVLHFLGFADNKIRNRPSKVLEFKQKRVMSAGPNRSVKLKRLRESPEWASLFNLSTELEANNKVHSNVETQVLHGNIGNVHTEVCGQDAGSRNLGPFVLRNSVHTEGEIKVCLFC